MARVAAVKVAANRIVPSVKLAGKNYWKDLI
jgi:hypothetical protein